MCLKTNSSYKSFKENIFELLLSTRVVGEDDFLTRAIFDVLHFSPSECSGFLTALARSPADSFGEISCCLENWSRCIQTERAAQGRVSLAAGYNPPHPAHEGVQRGLWRVRNNSAGQQLLTFSWLEARGCGFTRLSLQHQFWLLVFPSQPFPTVCFVVPPTVPGPLGSPGVVGLWLRCETDQEFDPIWRKTHEKLSVSLPGYF